MDVFEVEPAEYDRIFSATYHVFNSTKFNELNAGRCDKLLFLVFKDTKYRLGLIAGVRGDEIFSPYSAPFGGFSFQSEDITIKQLEAGVDALLLYLSESGFSKVHYTMPPAFYNALFNNKLLNVFFRKNFQVDYIDMNYEFDLDQLNADYESHIWYNAKKNLKIAMKQNLVCYRCETENQIEDAYNVIKSNRELKKIPLKMTFEQVKKTTSVIDADFFILEKDSTHIAAAQVFHVAPGIVQVIYWGEIPDFANYKPINYLSYFLISHYQKAGIKYIDIGPSTEHSVPNYGLCEFKESIGCTISPKYSFTYTLRPEAIA